MPDWDEYIIKASEILSVKENHQRVLGKLASDIAQQFGNESLGEFSQEIKDTHGLNIAPSTLQNYRWVYDSTHEFDLPEDLSYRTLQYIASSKKAEYWAGRINDEGLSSAEVYRLIREEKGLAGKKTTSIVCPHCGATFDHAKS